ncbi:MAG: amidophosphoribosyltransferase [Ignisphaera sp.]
MGGVAVYASTKPNSSATDLVLALLIELQHRGQEATGITVAYTDGNMLRHTSRGTALDLLNNGFAPQIPTGTVFGVLGYTKYSASVGLDPESQPIIVEDKGFRIAVAFDGAIANYRLLAKELNLRNRESYVHAFSEAIHKLALEYGKDVVEAIRELSTMAIGGYSITIITSEPRIVIARDPHGFRPLAYLFDGEKFLASSESSALEVLGYSRWREVLHGEIISFDGKSLEATRVPAEAPTPCVFEYVYIARLDTIFNGINVYDVRVGLGYELAKIAPANADVVIPVPDSGRAAAIGYSKGSGIPFEEGLVANRYLGRGFIMSPGLREVIAKLKYGIIKSSIHRKRIALVDDSIVRGTTMAAIASRLRDLGAKEVHIRISCPPFMYPCFVGVDVASKKELLAWKTMGSREIARALNADTVAFNTIENLIEVVGLPSLCIACFTGIYPFKDFSAEDLGETFS